ncbi:hypothetical protein E2C01_102734 [Portunus trituberculatus]|uniref:Uncharacterized protein n=1 Tax=Portunus trituberculatus TaxID=210409 RepID=A0A5B7KDD5_PORTR|nr:hypothetical protein [Portunus trituberculatus]
MKTLNRRRHEGRAWAGQGDSLMSTTCPRVYHHHPLPSSLSHALAPTLTLTLTLTPTLRPSSLQ